MDLPDIVAHHIQFDEEMIQWLHLTFGSVVLIGGLSFDADDYWRAVEQTLRAGSALITPQDASKEYRLIRRTDDQEDQKDRDQRPGFAVLDVDGNHIQEISDPSLGLLVPDENTRRTNIVRLRAWFDCEHEEFDAIASQLISNDDPVRRMASFNEWRKRSTELHYRGLEQRLRGGENVSWSETLPNVDSLRARMRFPTKLDESFGIVLQNSAQSLLEEGDLVAVLARFCSLPVVLPQMIIDIFTSLETAEKAKILERLSKSWTSPIRLLHVLNLSLRCFPESGMEIVENLLPRLYSEKGTEDFASFKAVLNFVNEEIAYVEGVQLWSPEIRLALTWIHACRLHDLVCNFGVSSQEICSSLESRFGPLRNALLRDGVIWSDCAYPLRLDRTVLLTHGIASMVTGIESSLLANAGLLELIRKEALQTLGDGTSSLARGLLRDPTLPRNSLCSFLGTDRQTVLAPILDDEPIDYLACADLKRSVEHDLKGLAADPSAPSLWMGVAVVTNDLPIYSDLEAVCYEALKSFDPFVISPDRFADSMFVFRTAAFQVTHLQNDTLRDKYRDHVLEYLKREVAGTCESGEEDIPLERRVFSLIQIASILSYVPAEPKKSSEEFTSMLEKMATIWPDFVKHYASSLSTEVWDMPIDESEAWWHLTLSLRSVA